MTTSPAAAAPGRPALGPNDATAGAAGHPIQPDPTTPGEPDMSTSARYRKKPVVIDAVRWDGRLTTALDFITEIEVSVEDRTAALFLPTLEGEMRADVGDWIIRGVAGEYYPCKPDIFEATYESAEGSAS